MFLNKNLVLFGALLFSFTLFAQQPRTATFGTPSHHELTMTSYDKDPDASAVVLFEKGNNYFKYNSNTRYVYIYKEVYRKIKVFDAKSYNQATVEINLYGKGSEGEKITDFKALTHNGAKKTYVKDSDLFDIDLNENWSSKRFTFPDVQDGSILEYRYTIRTLYFFSFNAWYFQGMYPKIYSEFNSEIPGNYSYKRAIYGKLNLYINNAKVKRDCFSVPFLSNPADCEVSQYAMEHIPAFKEESYMLSKSNYIAKVDYELDHYYNFNGEKVTFSKTWKDVDKEFKHDKDVGRQLNNNSFFKDKIPSSIFSIKDDLEKAKAVYSYIQDYFSWDGNYSVYSKARVKQAYSNKSGSSTEINLALVNALQAVGLQANMTLHSTRDNGLPALAYPVISDYNYVLVYLKVEEDEYLLDASEKFTPFGIIPFRALNLRTRVMDYKEGSFWHAIIPNDKNVTYTASNLSIKDDVLTGSVDEIATGYRAINKRNKYHSTSESSYLLKKDEEIQEMEIVDFSVENTTDIDQPFKEKYAIEYNPELIANKVYINPFFLQKELTENPFTSDERSFPVNLGFPFSNTYMMTIDLNNSYEVEQLPTNKVIEFAGGTGQCKIIFANTNGKVSLRFAFKLTDSHFVAEDYVNLKEFFKQVADVLNDVVIVLKKL